MYTAGTVAQYAGPMDAGRTLALHMYVLSSEGLHMKEAFATAVVLLVMVLLILSLIHIKMCIRDRSGAAP